MLWYSSGWEILQKHEHTAIFNPHALSGFSLFAEIPQKRANYCTDVGFFFCQIILTLSAQFIYSSKWLPAAERFVFLLLTYARVRLVAKG